MIRSSSVVGFVYRLLDRWDDRAIRREVLRLNAADNGARTDLRDLLKQEGIDA